MFKFQFRILLVLLVLSMTVTAVVTISTDKSSYSCDVSNHCELVNIDVYQHGTPVFEPVQLEIGYTDDSGEITNVVTTQQNDSFSRFWHRVTHRNKWISNDSFILKNKDNYFDMNFNAYGSGKFNISVVGVDSGTIYDTLDPWWNSSFQYRVPFNLTSSSDTLTDFQVRIIFNNTNINYSSTNDNGSDLRFTWLNQTSGEEQEIPYWIREDTGWNKSDNSYVYVLAPKIDADGEQFYYYYGNTTAVESKSNGFNVFEAFDDFEGSSLNTTLWRQIDTGGSYSVNNGYLNLTANGGLGSHISFQYQQNNISSPNYFILSRHKTQSDATDEYYWSASYVWDNGTSKIWTSNNFSRTHLGRNTESSKVINNETSQVISNDFVDHTQWHNYLLEVGNEHQLFYIDEDYKGQTNVSIDSKSLILELITSQEDADYETTPRWGAWDYIAIGKYSSNIITQSFGAEEKKEKIQIISPLNNSEVFNQNTPITFKTKNTSENHNIYIDGILNKTINVTSSPWTEYFNFTTGQHNLLITLASDESVNDSINFTAKDFIITSTTYNSEEYELMYSPFNTTIRHAIDKNVTKATMNYNNTIYSMTLNNYNDTTTYATTTIFTPFLGASNYTYYNFTINATANDSSTDIYNNSQKIIIGYYISNTSVNQPTIIEGGIEESNITVTMKTDYAIIHTYSTLESVETTATEQGNYGEKHYWSSSYNVPEVTTSTDYNVTYYITVTYGETTAIRKYTGSDIITVIPLSVGVCGGIYTIPILNYSAWDEKNFSKQITTNNYWETKVIARAPEGNVNNTFGFTGTGATHRICLETNESIILDVATWVSNNESNYVKRSYFIQNTAYSNESTEENIRIHLLNISDASVVNFIVKDAFDTPQQNRIIKFFKFDATSQDYKEMFNLLTDINGKAVGFVEAYDQWYKIIVMNSNHEATATIPSTQFDTATYPIVETSSEFGKLKGITWLAQWNNASKVFSLTVGSDDSRTFQLKLIELGIFANTTYDTKTFTGTSGILYSDLSNSSQNEFRWILSYEGEDVTGNKIWIPVTSGIVEQPETPPYGLTGLILTGFLVILGSTLYLKDARNLFIMIPIILTIARAFQLFTVSYYAIMAIWAVALALVYILRGEK